MLAGLWLAECSTDAADSLLPELLLTHTSSSKFVGPMEMSFLPLSILRAAEHSPAASGADSVQYKLQHAVAEHVRGLITGLSLQVSQPQAGCHACAWYGCVRSKYGCSG